MKYPDLVGLDLTSACDLTHIPGAVAIVADRARTIYQGAFGIREFGKDTPMTLDSVFWIASCTKAITAVAAMQLVERGKLALDTPIAAVLPDFLCPQVLVGFDATGEPLTRPAKVPITLRHLMTHTSGFSYDMWNGEMVKYLEVTGTPPILSCRNAALDTPLVADPGTRWEYGTSADFVGKAVEAVSGRKLGEYFFENVFEPFGMRDTSFKISASQRQRLVGVHTRGNDGSLQSMPFELEQNPEFEMGGGGLYGTAGDFVRFTQMILNGGSLDGHRILDCETVDLMSQNHIGDLKVMPMISHVAFASNDFEMFPGVEKKWGLGFMINTGQVPWGRSSGSLSWAGLANTYFWIDPARGLTGVLFMQVLPFADSYCLDAFEQFERAVYAESIG